MISFKKMSRENQTNPDKVHLSLIFSGWTLLLIEQDQPHLFIAQQRLLIKLPPRETFKTAFPPLWPVFPVCLVYLVFVLLPKAHFNLFDLCLAVHVLAASWLIWILLSAGGTAACWGRNVVWHL